MHGFAFRISRHGRYVFRNHVSNGGFNPVLTILAIALWASDYIVKEWKGTRFR